MKRLALAAFFILFVAAAVNVHIPIKDEGVLNGTTSTDGLNCVGAGIVCNVEGRTATITVASPLAAGVFSGMQADCTNPGDGGLWSCPISDSVNVASAKRADGGYYKVTLTTAASDSDYNVQAGASGRCTASAHRLTSSTFDLFVFNTDAGETDCGDVSFLVNDFQ